MDRNLHDLDECYPVKVASRFEGVPKETDASAESEHLNTFNKSIDV